MVGLTRSELIERLFGRTRSKEFFLDEGRNDKDMLVQAFDIKDCDISTTSSVSNSGGMLAKDEIEFLKNLKITTPINKAIKYSIMN